MQPENSSKTGPLSVLVGPAILAGLVLLVALFIQFCRSSTQETLSFDSGVGVVFTPGGRLTGSVLRPNLTCDDATGSSVCPTSFGRFTTDHDLLIVKTTTFHRFQDDWPTHIRLADASGRVLSTADAGMDYTLVGAGGQAVTDRQALRLGQAILRSHDQEASNSNSRVFYAQPWYSRSQALFDAVLQHDASQHSWVWILEHQAAFRRLLRQHLQQAADAVQLPGDLHPRIDNVRFSMRGAVPNDIQALVNADAQASSAVLRARALLAASKKSGVPLAVLEKTAPATKTPLVAGMNGSTDSAP